MNTIVLVVAMAVGEANGETPTFLSAKPIWPKGREKEKNLFVGFRASFQLTCEAYQPRDRLVLRVAASTLYRAFLNGEFIGHGPARGPHGYYRVDEWELGRHLLQDGENVVAIEVAGYNVNSYYLLDQPAFLQAEVVLGDGIVASTAGSGAPFEARVLPERVQKVQRFSFQRPFIEVYRLEPGYDSWRSDASVPFGGETCTVQPAKRLLPRRVPTQCFSVRPPVDRLARGLVETGVQPQTLWKDRALTDVGPELGGYPEEELETIPSIELQQVRTIDKEQALPFSTKYLLGEKTFEILDFGVNLTGFIGATVTCHESCRLFLLFDEILSEGDVNFKRLGCVQAVAYFLNPGGYRVESFEPYTLRYLKLLNLEGSCTVENVYLRQYANPGASRGDFASPDPRINRLFVAGCETFRQNAVDLFMDCPSRERAGWLCDSFFTARAAFDLTGNTVIERNFFENFLLPKRFDHLPKGMLPMCYPADHPDGVYIPNWALWFVVQLEEYVQRSGDTTTAMALKPKVLNLFKFFDQYKNSDGLLERLESWVFVEWSEANRFVQDVNYPTNMLYARALDASGKLYRRKNLREEAHRVRETIRAQSFDGDFFVDNALRREGALEVTRNRTEACQYYAFYFDVATPESHPDLWRKLRDEFGPHRKERGLYPEVHPANSFLGNMLRFELLSRYGECEQILSESVDYLHYMAEKTGTLWENVGDYASCNHGFASHIVHTLYRDVLGLYEVDVVNKQVHLRFAPTPLEWCQGTRPLPDGAVSVHWEKQDDRLRYRVNAPPGYQIEVTNLTGLELTKML